MLKPIGFKLILCISIFVSTAAQEINPNTESVFETDDIPNNLGFSHLSEGANERNLTEILQQADDCKCENGKCLKNKKGEEVCVCPTEYGLYSPKKCKECKCGKGINCTFADNFWNTKTCLCQEEYGDNNGKCEACNCGKGSNCTFSGSWNVKKKCICKKGYKVEENICKGPCSPDPCKNGGSCIDIPDSYKCACPPKYTGLNCEESNTDPCTSNPCQNGGACNVTGKGFTCTCKSPYTGKICETGPCTSNPCQNGGTCNVTGKGFTCTCKSPYTGKLCETDPCTSNPCQNGGACNVTGKGFTCTCKSPYTGKLCEKGPCTSNPCQNGGTCNVTDKGFTCTCESPYTGKNCETGPCTSNPCQNGGMCNVTGKGFTCTCKSPFTGKLCETDPCTSNPCQNGGTCNVTSKGFYCTCKSPYTGKLCETDPCDSNPCKNNGTCKVEKESYKCTCKTGYSGRNCESDPCSTEPCQNNGICKVEKGTYKCECKPGYSGKRCEIDLCSSKPCQNNGTCGIEQGSYKCTCKTGYSGKNCENDPCSTKPCQNNGSCVVENGTYKCKCKPGYSGKACENEVTPSTISSTTSKKATPSTASTMITTSAETSTLSSSTTQTASTTVLAKRTSSTISSTHSTKTSPSTISTKSTSSTVSSTYSPSPTVLKNSTSTSSPSTILTKGTSSTVSSTYSMKTSPTSTSQKISPSSTSPSAILNKTSTMTTQSTLSTRLISKTTQINLETSSIINGTSDIARRTTQSYPHTSSKMPYKICKNNPCKNGGTCIEETDGQKCLCPYPYGGPVCENSEWCAEGMGKTLCSSNNCRFNFTTNVGYCECAKDQYYDYAKRSCEVIDKCPLMITKCRGINEECRNSECQCKEHFKRNSEKKCIPNFCDTKPNPCGENEFCEDLLDDPGNVKCTCKEGYVFNGKTCEKVNKCDLPGTLGCSQICHPSDESCDCRPGFTLQSDNKTCRISNPSSQCKKNNCGVGSCVTTGGRDLCICPRTHKAKGLKCIDLCTAKEYPKGICPGEACLPDEKLGFKCKCEGKLTYDKNGVTCKKKLMCSEGNGTKTCAAKAAVCVEDADAPAGYRCECSKNQEKDADGICRGLCELKKYQELCKQRSAVCDINGLNNCKCPPLLSFDDQERCTVIAQASYTAVLPLASSHYVSNVQYSPSQGESGSVVDYDAITKDLQASMHLLFGPNYKFADVLNCNNSSKTLTCTVEIQFNSDPKEQLKLITQPGTCISSNSEDCFIPPALTLRKKEIKPDIITPTDPCLEDIKNKICGPDMVCNKAQDGSRNFECKCSQGFSSFGFYQPFSDKRTIIHKCQDINECLLTNACPNGTECLNGYGTFECPCKEGYKPFKEHSDTKIVGCEEICDSKLCVHGTCEFIGAQFRCKCESGYTGFNCDEEATVAGKKGMRTALIVMSSIVVPLLLLVIFIIHKYRILKKKSYKSNYLDDGYSTIGLVPMRR